MSGLLCGAAKACITPPAEMIPGLYGLMNKRFASVHDDLYLRVIAFGNGEEKALVVGFDLDKAPRPEENLKALTEVTGIPEERILYFGIHTHTAPLTGPRPPFEQPKDEFTAATTARYEAMIAGKLLGAAKEAIASMREVRLGVAEGMSYINVNRNQVFEYEEPETGKIYRYLGLGANFEGPVDHFVRTLKAEDPDGKTVALLVNYACHNVVMIGNDADGQGNVAIGGDVGGNVSRMLEEKYGSVRLVAVMAVTALVTGLINNLLFGNVALCGASGIVFAFILLTSFTSFKEGEIPLTFILVAVIYLGQQIVDGITVRDNISNLSHILGGIVGGAAGYVLNRKH